MTFDLNLFDEHWHLGCHRRELSIDGDFIKLNTIRGDIVLFNDAGTIVAFDNKCPHRGARIYGADHGNQPASCGYHGWTYRKGTLIVPERERFKACAIDQADFNKYAVEWCGDFVFFGVRPLVGLYEQLGATAEILENISFNIDARLDLNRYDYECYWPLAIENALEPYHISTVHSDTLATLQLEDGNNVFDGDNSVWYAPVGSARVNAQLARLGRHFNIDYQFKGYMSVFIYPFTMISSTYGYSYSLQNFFPSAGDNTHTKFTSRLYSANTMGGKTAQILDPFFASTIKVNQQVFEEDHDICKLLPKESWSMEPLAFASDSEAKIDHFRQCCRKSAERALFPAPAIV
jgi:phenylpropionate dioxygenase-like ring-hydroxylating dioxygenase large terminal subunit